MILLTASTSASIKLSKDATISILTCSPGNELYSLFGHTGIRVVDKANDMDIVFNYGTLILQPKDFTSNLHVVYSPTNYRVPNSVVFYPPTSMMNVACIPRPLNLDSIQKQYLMDLLFENYQPANREYLYNFLYDNCSTRVRDIIEKSTNNQITWIAQPSTKSFWNLLDEYLSRFRGFNGAFTRSSGLPNFRSNHPGTNVSSRLPHVSFRFRSI